MTDVASALSGVDSGPAAGFDEVRKALTATLPVGVHTANVYVEHRAMVTARFADSRIVDMSIGRRSGSNVRWITPERSLYRAHDSVAPGDVARFVRGDRVPHAGTAATERSESLVGVVETLD